MSIINGVGRVGIRNYVSPTTSSSYLLDTYGGAAVGYSLRKLSSTYTGFAIRVRRSSDNTEQNIGFDSSGNLDTTSLLSFVGAGNGFVTTWYDQSGSNRNAIQTTASAQPQIVFAGIVNSVNGKASINFISGNKMPFTEIASTGGMEIFGVSTFATTGGGGSAWDINSPIQAYTGAFIQDFGIGTKNGCIAIYSENNNSVSLQTTAGISTNVQYVFNGYGSTTSTGVGFNNSNYTIGAATRNDLLVRSLGQDSSSIWFSGNLNEIVVYPIVQPTNRSNINSNINSYYSIYTSYTTRTAAFATATGITDTTILNALNTFDTGLISNGLDTKMKALYPFVGGNATTHKYNFMNAQDTDAAFRLQFNGGWIHSNTGALPNGTNAYADSFWVPFTQSSNDNVSYNYYSRTNTSGAANFGGSGGGYVGTTAMYISLNGASNYATINGMGYLATSSADSRGLFGMNTTTNNIFTSWKNGTKSGTRNYTTNDGYFGITNVRLWIGGCRAPVAEYGNMECAFFNMSTGLSDSEQSTFYGLVQAFQTALSRQV
jgi:hypothetical protein